MRVIAKRTLRTFWESDPRAEQPLKAWYAIAAKAYWSSPTDVKMAYGNASIVGNDRVVFNIGGALLHDSTAARVGALFQLLVQDTTAQDFGLPSSAIRLRM